MNKHNRLYHIAAAGAVVLLAVAAIGLLSGGAGKAAASSQADAVRNAYEQGYLDGYSKGYQEAYATASESCAEQIRTMYATPTRTGCASSTCPTPTLPTQDEEESDDSVSE